MTAPTVDPLSTADEAEFEALVRRSDLTLTPAQRKDLRIGYGYIKSMAARVRGQDKRPREAEPATIFRPDR